MKAGWAILMAAGLLGACARPAEKPAPPPARVEAPASPARGTDLAIEPLALTFEGVLPCPDCPGIRTTLVLTRKAAGWAEGTYRLTEAYIDRGVSPIVTTGDWTTLRGDAVDDDASVYELNPDQADRARHFLRVGDDAALRALTRDLKPWPKGTPDRLERRR
jgi:hypothetical protein